VLASVFRDRLVMCISHHHHHLNIQPHAVSEDGATTTTALPLRIEARVGECSGGSSDGGSGGISNSSERLGTTFAYAHM
jgi:hypothetical protein